MLRLFLVFTLPAVLIACSQDKPAPIAPSGKAVATADAPPRPTNLRIEALTDTSAKAAWDAVEGATDYDLNYRTLTGRWTNWPVRGAQKAHTTIYRLLPETEYRWAVRAENKDGASRWVFAENFTTLATPPPPVVPDEPAPEEEAAELTFTFVEPVEVEEEFNIELVFLDSFTQKQKGWIKDVAQRWQMYFSGAPDYTFTHRRDYNVMGQSFTILAGNRIDDLRVYIADSSADHSLWEGEAGGWATVIKFRPDGKVPLIALIGLNASQLDENIISVEWGWKKTFQHELAHAFGIGTSLAWGENIVMRNLYDPQWKKKMDQFYYTGANALREYYQLHPNPHSAGIRVGINDFQERKGVHWLPIMNGSEQEPFLAFDIFDAYFSHTSGGTNMSRVSLGAFEDIGWSVRYDQAMSQLLFDENINDCWLHTGGYEWLDFVIDCQ